MDFFKDNASKDYECNFDFYKPLKELKLQEETKGLIAMICLNYWCETEEQKKIFIKKLNENEKKYQEEQRKKYNPDDIFKNQTISTEPIQNEPVVTETALLEYKETIFDKIKKRIKSLFNNLSGSAE